MLAGEWERILDNRGRIVIPASFRNHFSGELVIMKGLGSFLWIMTTEYFADRRENIGVESRRCFLESAQTVKINQKSGRITVPPALIAYAQLSKSCTIIGQKDYLELWDTGVYGRL